MVQWEYCRLLWLVHEVRDETAERLRATEADIAIIDEPGPRALVASGELVFARTPEAVQPVTDLHGTLTQLGLAGWELVSHTQVVQPTPVEAFYFKRPLQA
jgi:hypothetical protein